MFSFHLALVHFSVKSNCLIFSPINFTTYAPIGSLIFLFDSSLTLYHLLLASHCPCSFLALVLLSFIYTHIANCSLIISTHCHVNPFKKLFIIFISKMPLQGQNSFPKIFILSGLCVTYIYIYFWNSFFSHKSRLV
jgi:hypothetical protein